ncbi:alpha/beta hydrolase [Empedobacter brevis]|uniref:alpha/beta hydrolase n=1 Tax=Empedobacter brevis TaxID=247 RepID=UPI0039B0CF21
MKILNILILSAFVQPMMAQTIQRQEIYSAKMKKDIPTIIVTPELKKDVRYKTVYILHGYSGNPERTIQSDIPDLQQKANDYSTIYVIPDGNYNSWYVDSPIDSSSQYKTFIGEELVHYIDKHFPTEVDRSKRGILGWSMGGYGAMHIGVAYPKTFSIVGSSCGALNFELLGENYQNYQVNKVLGDFLSLDATYKIYENENKMKTNHQFYILDCGTEDVEMLEMNRVFHQHLTDKNIKHLYIESDGSHNTNYWSKSLTNQLALFQNYFGK